MLSYYHNEKQKRWRGKMMNRKVRVAVNQRFCVCVCLLGFRWKAKVVVVGIIQGRQIAAL